MHQGTTVGTVNRVSPGMAAATQSPFYAIAGTLRQRANERQLLRIELDEMSLFRTTWPLQAPRMTITACLCPVSKQRGVAAWLQ